MTVLTSDEIDWKTCDDSYVYNAAKNGDQNARDELKRRDADIGFDKGGKNDD